MKTVDFILTRSIFALVIGLILIIWPNSSMNTLVIIIGVLFALLGIWMGTLYFKNRNTDANRNSTSGLIISILSLFIGILLISMPHLFVKILMYVITIVLIIAAITQIISLYKARKEGNNRSFIFYLLPIVVLIVAIVVLFNPSSVAAFIFIIMGIACLLYAIEGFTSWFKLRKK